MKIGVLADDLTGAFDTGVQYRNWGLSVEVLIGDLKEISKLDCVDVVVVDTESRGLKKEDAFFRVYRATERLTKLGVEMIYKKIDSTLRGNIGTELDAAMEASKIKFTFFAPAYPTYKRTTLAGKQYVNNKPLDKTEYADELGAKTARISSLIGVQSKRKVGLVGFDTVKNGVNSIKTRIEARARGVDKFHIVEEIEPGIPLLTLSNGMHAVTKAGGFGREDSLVQVTQKLRRLMAK